MRRKGVILHTIIIILVHKALNVDSDSNYDHIITNTSPEKHTAGCSNADYDLLFMIDNSASIGHSNFKSILSWTAELTDTFEIGKDLTRVGVLTFGEEINYEIKLDNNYGRRKLKEKILKLKVDGGSEFTKTGQAISFAANRIFNPEYHDLGYSGMRDPEYGYPRLVIFITDGNKRTQENRPDILGAINQLKNRGVTIYLINIGQESIQSDILDIASSPASMHIYKVLDVNRMGRVSDDLRRKICIESLCPNGQIVRNPLLNYDKSGNARTKTIRGFDILATFHDYMLHNKWFEFSDPSKWFLKQAYNIKNSPKLKTPYVFGKGLPSSFTIKMILRFDFSRRKNNKGKQMHLFALLDDRERKQLAITVNPRHKYIEFYGMDRTMNPIAIRFGVDRYPVMEEFFDGGYHKLLMRVNPGSVTAFLDSVKLGTRQTRLLRVKKISLGRSDLIPKLIEYHKNVTEPFSSPHTTNSQSVET